MVDGGSQSFLPAFEDESLSVRFAKLESKKDTFDHSDTGKGVGTKVSAVRTFCFIARIETMHAVCFWHFISECLLSKSVHCMTSKMAQGARTPDGLLPHRNPRLWT